jgi:GNAT superfamily N-acetyltransferase
MELAYRPVTLDDAPFAADVLTARFPDRPRDPVMMRYAWEHLHTTDVQERFIVQTQGEAIGFAGHSHPAWEATPKRWGRVFAELLPAHRTHDHVAEAHRFAEERSRQSGAGIFRAYSREDDASAMEVLSALGYQRDRYEKFWELDVVAKREHLLAMAERTRARMREQGILVHTLDRERDPQALRKLYDTTVEAGRDVPSTMPYVAEPFEDFVNWLTKAPGIHPERTWVARLGEDLVGISVLFYPPVRGAVETSWTGTARSIRGRGVARALKLETVAQAISLGVTRVQTDNDSTNAPILHLNEEMGYQQIPGVWSYLKRT